MKRYIFSFSLSVLFFSAPTFGMVDEAYYLTIFTKEDVAKYWLMKQLYLQDMVKKDIIELRINPLLASMKDKHIERRSDLRRMNINKFAYVTMDEGSPVRGHYFAFDKSMSLSRNNFLQMAGLQNFVGPIPGPIPVLVDTCSQAVQQVLKKPVSSKRPYDLHPVSFTQSARFDSQERNLTTDGLKKALAIAMENVAAVKIDFKIPNFSDLMKEEIEDDGDAWRIIPRSAIYDYDPENLSQDSTPSDPEIIAQRIQELRLSNGWDGNFENELDGWDGIRKLPDLESLIESPVIFPPFYTDGRMWGGNGIHEFLPIPQQLPSILACDVMFDGEGRTFTHWSPSPLRQAQSLSMENRFEKAYETEQVETDSSSDLDLISFVSYDVD
jgi:hypothetical protein